MKQKRTVILDTDIGGDIDDTWALAMLLNSPELDPRLVVTATADTVYRARITAKFLDRSDRSDIAVGVGLRGVSDGPRERQKNWIADYQLERYPGRICEDGIQAMIELVEQASEPVWLIAIGPLTNIAELIRRQPGIAAKIHLVAMMGSIAKTHEGAPGAIAEFNVVKDIAAAQAVFAATWRDVTITPLDSCGVVILDGELYRKVFEAKNRLARDVIENYLIWAGNSERSRLQSSILYDTVAVHLAYSTEFIAMRTMKLIVDDQGFTREAPTGRDVNVALDWLDLGGYKKSLVQRLSKGRKTS